MKRGLTVAVAGAAILAASISGCSTNKSTTSGSGTSSAAGTSVSAGTGSAPKVTIDGKDQNVSGSVVCTTAGGTVNIAIGGAATGIAAVLTDANPPMPEFRDDYVLQEVDADYLAKAVKPKQFIHIDQSECIMCEGCVDICPWKCIHMVQHGSIDEAVGVARNSRTAERPLLHVRVSRATLVDAPSIDKIVVVLEAEKAVARSIVFAWVLTIPAAAICAAIFYWPTNEIFS